MQILSEWNQDEESVNIFMTRTTGLFCSKVVFYICWHWSWIYYIYEAQKKAPEHIIYTKGLLLEQLLKHYVKDTFPYFLFL